MKVVKLAGMKAGYWVVWMVALLEVLLVAWKGEMMVAEMVDE
jgi:hypothetical protein